MKINRKEKFMFWLGSLMGITGGILGNLLVGSAFDIANKGYNIFNTSIYLITFIIFILISIIIYNKLKGCLK